MRVPLDFLKEREKILEMGGYALIANLGAIDSSTQEVSPEIKLRRATPIEVKELRNLFKYLQVETWRNPYETRVEHEPNEVGHTTDAVALPESDFRYHVAEFVGGNMPAHNLIQASTLTSHELELGPDVVYGAGRIGIGRSSGLQRFLSDADFDDAAFVSLGISEGADLVDVYRRLAQHDNALVDLGTAIQDYLALREIPKSLGIRLLGHFAILESLLTHKPEPKDAYDSIIRQVKKKMALLNRRFIRPLEYGNYFGRLPPEIVWTKLYGLRSALAHGSRPDFTKELQALGDIGKASRFVQLATSCVMRHALDEPRLLADLKEC
jgi:hypothetical protein